jgi:hypothetical protein
MRQKNIRRAAEALFVSQGDDKNKILASFIENKEVSKRVADQGRALLILERLCLPQGKFSFSLEEIHGALMKKLEKKGHRIQDDDTEDDEQYSKEKETALRQRIQLVPEVLGRTLEDLTIAKEEQPDEEQQKQEELEEAREIQKRLLDDLPEVSEVEDTTSGEVNTEIDLPEVAWQLIGQAYIDGIRTGRNV